MAVHLSLWSLPEHEPLMLHRRGRDRDSRTLLQSSSDDAPPLHRDYCPLSSSSHRAVNITSMKGGVAGWLAAPTQPARDGL